MTYKSFLKINLLVLSFYLIGFYLPDRFFLSNIFKIAIGFAILGLSGINFVSLLETILKRKFNKLEFLNLFFLSIITVLPAILLIEVLLLKKIFDWLPIFNALFIILSLAFIKFKRKEWDYFLSNLNIKHFYRKLNPIFLLAFFILLAVIVINFSVYPFLPDKDPLKWIFRLSTYFNQNSFSSPEYRPLFPATVFMFTNLLDIEIFTFFKYFLPLISLSILLPIWLVARTFSSTTKQLILLLSAMITPNVILYSQTAMPQAFFIFLLYFFIFFLIYGHIKKDDFYFYIAGIISLVSIFFHEIAVVVFLFWIFVFLFSSRKLIFANKRDFFYLVIIIFSNYSLLKMAFAQKWLTRLFLWIANAKSNWQFPMLYKNIDGNNMGWETLTGVIKYYLFYAGPFIFGLTVFILFFCFSKKDFLKNMWNYLKSDRNMFIIFLCFATFFSISEIFPRFPGIALLPDRSWVFTGIFFSIFLFAFIRIEERLNLNFKKIYISLFFLYFVGISGAIYINYQKSFLITQEELRSANWIKKNLPDNRLIFSYKQNFIEFYSESTNISITKDLYFGNDLKKTELFIEKRLPKILTAEEDEYFIKYRDYMGEKINEINASLNNNETNSYKKIETTTSFAKDIIKISGDFINGLPPSNSPHKNAYIYFSKAEPRNPYLQRPYEKNRSVAENDIFIFDIYPEKFQRIYQANNEEVIIWKILFTPLEKNN